MHPRQIALAAPRWCPNPQPPRPASPTRPRRGHPRAGICAGGAVTVRTNRGKAPRRAQPAKASAARAVGPVMAVVRCSRIGPDRDLREIRTGGLRAGRHAAGSTKRRWRLQVSARPPRPRDQKRPCRPPQPQSPADAPAMADPHQHPGRHSTPGRAARTSHPRPPSCPKVSSNRAAPRDSAPVSARSNSTYAPPRARRPTPTTALLSPSPQAQRHHRHPPGTVQRKS